MCHREKNVEYEVADVRASICDALGIDSCDELNENWVWIVGNMMGGLLEMEAIREAAQNFLDLHKGASFTMNTPIEEGEDPAARYSKLSNAKRELEKVLARSIFPKVGEEE